MLDPTQEESEAPGSRNPLALIGQLKPLLVLDKKKMFHMEQVGFTLR